MKNLLRSLFAILILFATSMAYSAMPPTTVTVSDASGKLAYKGTTGSNGVFASGKLAPGDYVVQFHSAGMPAGNYAVVVSAGKQKVMAEAVASEKFNKGGVAMRLKVGSDMNITGQISPGKSAAGSQMSDNTRVRIINGKKYVWVSSGGTGSHIGGRWVEEGSAGALNVQRVSPESIQALGERR